MSNQELWEAVHLEDYERVRELLEKRDEQHKYQDHQSYILNGEKNSSFGWAYRYEDGGYEWRFPLVEAARTGNLEIAKILRKYHATTNPERSESALHAAFLITEREQCKSREMIRYLVEEGADVNASRVYFPSPLQQAIALNDIETVEYLLQKGADVNRLSDFSKDKLRPTALETAILQQNPALVKLLISHGADPSLDFLEQAKALGNEEIINAVQQRVREMVQVRGLLEAIEQNDSAKVEELLQEGVDPNRGLYIKGYPYAVWIYPLIKAARTQNLSIVKMLIEHGANVNVTEPSDGATPLHAATSGALIRYLVEQGANVNAEGGFCLTPLLQAIYHKDIEIVEYLIQRGADVNKCLSSVDENEARTTAIGAAVQESNLPILELLIKYCGKTTVDPYCDITPLEEARELGNEKIIKLLIEAGYK